MYEIANSDCTGGIGKRAQTKAGECEQGQTKVNEGGWAWKMVDEDKWGQAKVNNGGQNKWGQVLMNKGQQHQQGMGTVTMGGHGRDRWVLLLLLLLLQPSTLQNAPPHQLTCAGCFHKVACISKSIPSPLPPPPPANTSWNVLPHQLMCAGCFHKVARRLKEDKPVGIEHTTSFYNTAWVLYHTVAKWVWNFWSVGYPCWTLTLDKFAMGTAGQEILQDCSPHFMTIAGVYLFI